MSHPTALAKAPALLLLLLLPHLPSAAAEPVPLPLKGTVLLHGGGLIAPETLQALRDRGGGSGRMVLVTASGDVEKAAAQRAAWAKRQWPEVSAFRIGDPGLVKMLEKRATVWLADGFSGGGGEGDAATARALGSVLERGGAIGGPAAELVGAFGGTLLPGVAASDTPPPGVVGYSIDPGTAVAIIGRHAVATGRGEVRLSLAASESGHRGPRRAAIRDALRFDHVAWRRSAIERTKPPFPPRPTPDFVSPGGGAGTVVIMGGGPVPRRGMRAFIDAAGGDDARIAVINTALGEPPPKAAADLRAFATVGAKNVRLLHAASRAEAGGGAFLAEIDAAGGVWFTGGRQWRLVDRYLGTAFEAALGRVLERGGAVGGTSAGATICGDYLVRGDPLTNRTMMAEGYERGFGLLPGVAVDQHFDTRSRLGDLIALKRHFPQLLALGLDETTAAIITGDTLRVAGLGKITVLDRPLPPATPRAGEHFTILNLGDRYDLRERKVTFRWPAE